jgi:hypothetical protein
VDCINLNEQFGDRFKVEYEESYYAQYGEHAWREDPHYMILLCRHGHIYPHGSATLAASISRRGRIANRMAGLDCVTVVQDGDDGINATFDVSDFDRIAEIMKPLKARPRLSEEHKAKLIEAGRQHRFSAGSRSPENDLESHSESVLV